MRSGELLPRREDCWRLLLLSGVCFLAAQLTLDYLIADAHLAVVWPLSGVALAGLLLGQARLWPAVAVAVLAAYLVHGLPPLAAVPIALGCAGAALIGVQLLRHAGDFDVQLNRSADYLKLVALGALAAPTISATVTAAALVGTGLVGQESIPRLWFDWWMADALGVLAAAPAILCWSIARIPPLSKARAAQGLFLLALLGVACLVVFGGWQSERFRALAHPYLTFPFLIWAAFVFGRRGVSLVTLLLLAAASVNAARGHGRFGIDQVDTAHLSFWLFGIVTSLAGMFLATLLAELRELNRQLARRTEDLRESEARFRSIADFASVMIWVTGPDMQRTWFNPAWLQFTGRTPDSELGDGWRASLHPDDAPRWLDVFRSAFAGRRRFEFEYRLRHRSGEYRWVIDHGAPRFDDIGCFLGFAGSCWDVTARKQAEASASLAAKVFEAGRDGIMITDPDNRIVSVNRAFTDITGWSADDVLGRNPRLLSSGRHPPAFYAALWQKVRDTGHWEGEIWNRHRDGRIYPEWLSVTAVFDEHGRLANHIGILTDISERKAAEEQIRRLAQHDYLTGLPNRALLFDRLHQTMAGARRYERRFALLFIDLDNFKPINDQLGHDAGDRVLREIARRLEDNVRESDTVSRHGGDEFVVLVPELPDLDHVVELAGKLLTIVGEPVAAGEQRVAVTASIGISLFPDDGDSVDALLRNADAAMYRAKNSGRNVVCFHNRQTPSI